MGRRGPPPKPTALRVLEGNPGKRPLNQHEPQPVGGLPRCPVWLSPAAKAAWRRVAPQLLAMHVLTAADADALAAYCQVYARWRAAEEFIAKHGDAYPLRDEHGRIRCMVQFPQVSIAKNLLHVLRVYQQEFGLTPSSRSQLKVDYVDPDDPEELLARALIDGDPVAMARVEAQRKAEGRR